MRGSDKQIAWASQIVSTLTAKIDNAINDEAAIKNW